MTKKKYRVIIMMNVENVKSEDKSNEKKRFIGIKKIIELTRGKKTSGR